MRGFRKRVESFCRNQHIVARVEDAGAPPTVQPAALTSPLGVMRLCAALSGPTLAVFGPSSGPDHSSPIDPHLGSLREPPSGETVSVSGWVIACSIMAAVLFIDLTRSLRLPQVVATPILRHFASRPAACRMGDHGRRQGAPPPGREPKLPTCRPARWKLYLGDQVLGPGGRAAEPCSAIWNTPKDPSQVPPLFIDLRREPLHPQHHASAAASSTPFVGA